MHALRVVSWLLLVLLVNVGSAQEAKDKKATSKQKLVGNWELVKTTSSDSYLMKLKMEFTNDGKFGAWLEGDKEPIAESTYEVNGDTIKWKKFKGADNHEETIKTLTEKQLILIQKTAGDRMETHEFKRIK